MCDQVDSSKEKDQDWDDLIQSMDFFDLFGTIRTIHHDDNDDDDNDSDKINDIEPRKLCKTQRSLSDHIIDQQHNQTQQKQGEVLNFIEMKLEHMLKKLEHRIDTTIQNERTFQRQYCNDVIERMCIHTDTKLQTHIETIHETMSQLNDSLSNLSNRVSILEDNIHTIKSRMEEEKEMLKDGMDLLRLKNQFIRRNVVFPFLAEHTPSLTDILHCDDVHVDSHHHNDNNNDIGNVDHIQENNVESSKTLYP